MKTFKLALSAVTGLAVLSATNSQALTPQAVPLAISLTSYDSTSVTNEAGVITYTASSSTLNSADIVAEAADTLGVTVPAGARLGISIVRDSVNDIYLGDVVVADATGQIIWDLTQTYSTENGSVYLEIYDYDYVRLDKNALKSSSQQFRGLSEIYGTFAKAPPVILGKVTPKGAATVSQGSELYIYGWDMASTGAYTQGNAGPRFTTGGISFAGAGQLDYYDWDTDSDSYYPFDIKASSGAGPLPANNYPFGYNSAD